MHPHSYTVDSLSKSQELASAILSSSSPSQISSVCASIDSFLHSSSPDQCRHFFSLTFPTLICKLYGFADASSQSPNGATLASSTGGWLDIILQSNDTDLASRLFTLLSPEGVLFQCISAVDRQSLIKYIFPTERLPEWARFMLSSEKDCQVLDNLCPLFRGKFKEDSTKGSLYYQVQLNVFEYYMFWFAYYPICKGNSENFGSTTTKRSKKLLLENWTSSICGFSQSKRGNEQKIDCNLYMRLLYAYLRAFVPIKDLASHQPYRSSLLHYGYGNDGSILLRAEFFVDTLVHYWLVDNDFSPLPVNVCKSFGLSIPLRSVLGETPPTPNLGEVVKLLVKYLNLSAAQVKEGFDCIESPKWSKVSLGSCDGKSRELVASMNECMRVGGSWNTWIQRPLYRFILRTFLFCPVGTSIKNASQVFLVWITYMEPWKSESHDFLELDASIDGSGKDVKKENESSKRENGYSSLWQDYVLSNYLYYSSLIMHFIGFAHKFLHTDPEVIVQMVFQVVKVLTSSKELTDLIKNMYAAFHSKQAGSGKLMLNSLHRYVPLIREELEDWEDGLCESDADGSFLHENWNKDLRLFSDGEDGGQQLLQLFILRAEAELQANSGDNLAQNLQLVDSLKAEVSFLFGSSTVKPISHTPERKQAEKLRDEVFKPRKVGNQSLVDVKYKGDWMRRPISDDEIAWLAKLLVWLSNWLNDILGLNQVESSDIAPKWSYVDVSNDVANVCTQADGMKMVLCFIGYWFLAVGGTAVRLMKKHGLRVNLRMLASKKIVMVLLVCAIFSILKKSFGMLYKV